MNEWTGPQQQQKRGQKQKTAIMHQGSETDFSSGSWKTHEVLLGSTGKISSSYRSPPVHQRSCGDNHGIKPPSPEQYLTPLQQKCVTIRHLKTKLRDSEHTVCDREAEINELKTQLSRMREDWIEEECRRVEAQLALKEAREEIKQLLQVVETMKSSLMEKNKGIQKYFIDIDIQNKKLESLLRSMELAQGEPTLDFICESLERSMLKTELQVKEYVVKEVSGGKLQVLTSTAVDSSQDGGIKTMPEPGLSTLQQSREMRVSSEEKGVQTDEMICTHDLQPLIPQLLKLQDGGLSGLFITSPSQPQNSHLQEKDEVIHEAQAPVRNKELFDQKDESPEHKDVGFSTSTCPNMIQTPENPTDSSLCCSEPETNPQFVKNSRNAGGAAVVDRKHWSSSFLFDLLAVAAPVVPTAAWLYSQHGLIAGPVYNITALIRGCCIMGLHALRHMPHRQDT